MDQLKIGMNVQKIQMRMKSGYIYQTIKENTK
jgi:hypothetical protein